MDLSSSLVKSTTLIESSATSGRVNVALLLFDFLSTLMLLEYISCLGIGYIVKVCLITNRVNSFYCQLILSESICYVKFEHFYKSNRWIAGRSNFFHA